MQIQLPLSKPHPVQPLTIRPPSLSRNSENSEVERELPGPLSSGDLDQVSDCRLVRGRAVERAARRGLGLWVFGLWGPNWLLWEIDRTLPRLNRFD